MFHEYIVIGLSSEGLKPDEDITVLIHGQD